MRRLIPIAFTCALLLGGSGHAGKPADPVDAVLAPYTGKVPGAALLVLKDGRVVLRRSVGLANVETGDKVGPDTNFRLASVSKQFTATAILQLAERGRVRLDDSVRRWLPELPATAQAITLHQLLAHRSGLVDYEDLIPAGRREQLDDHDVLDLLAAAPHTCFTPGSRYRYSNSGYVLLGLVAERASATRLPLYLRQHIFQPLGMDGTLLYERGHGPEITHRAFGYRAQDGAWVRNDQSLTSATRGDGGIYSSLDDLAKWAQALDEGRVLGTAMHTAMFSPQATLDGEPWHGSYGYGWRLTNDTIWHSGETAGFRNVIVRWPARRLTVIMLTNRDAPEPRAAALAIGALWP